MTHYQVGTPIGFKGREWMILKVIQSVAINEPGLKYVLRGDHEHDITETTCGLYPVRGAVVVESHAVSLP